MDKQLTCPFVHLSHLSSKCLESACWASGPVPDAAIGHYVFCFRNGRTSKNKTRNIGFSHTITEVPLLLDLAINLSLDKWCHLCWTWALGALSKRPFHVCPIVTLGLSVTFFPDDHVSWPWWQLTTNKWKGLHLKGSHRRDGYLTLVAKLSPSFLQHRAWEHMAHKF